MKHSIITDQLSMPFEAALEKIQEHELKVIELHSLWGKTIECLSKNEVKKLKGILAVNNLKISCLATTLFFMAKLREDYQLKSFSGEFLTFNGTADEHLEGVKHALEIANELDTDYIRVFPFRAPENRKIVGTDSDLALITDYIGRAAELAKKANRTLVLENCPHSHMPKGIMTKKVIDAINSPNLQLLWDPGNSFRADVDRLEVQYLTTPLVDELSVIAPSIAHVHLKDYAKNSDWKPGEKSFLHVPFGEGDIPYPTILKQMAAFNYPGALSLEPEVNDEDTLKSIINLKNMI